MLIAMAARSSPVMVGRAGQLAVLRDALETAGQGGYLTVLIGGEAGAGKSRLLTEFTADAAGGPARVLTGGCLQLGGDGLPFTPFVTVLRDLVRELGAGAVTAMVPGRGGPELARLLPELGEPDRGRDPVRPRLFEEWLTLLGRLPEPTREVLRVASSGIEPNGHALLAVVTGLSDEELARALRPAVAANVLLATPDGYSYRHALICEAVNDDLLPGEDERMHARFAAALDADPSLVAPGRAAIEAAHHWYWSRNATRALTSAWPAAAQAGRSAAYAERLASPRWPATTSAGSRWSTGC